MGLVGDTTAKACYLGGRAAKRAWTYPLLSVLGDDIYVVREFEVSLETQFPHHM